MNYKPASNAFDDIPKGGNPLSYTGFIGRQGTMQADSDPARASMLLDEPGAD